MARVPFTRRSLLQAGLIVPAVVDRSTRAAVPSTRPFQRRRRRCPPAPSASASAATGAVPVTTLDQTLLRGPAGNGGFVQLVTGAGEPHLTRSDLGMAAKTGREIAPLAVLTFHHLTDMHIVDAQSPARVEFLDRYDDAIPDGVLIAAYRPHEFLTAHVADTMAATLRAMGSGPVSKQPPAFAISTGDAVDNCQQNELRWVIDLLDGGGTVTPDSGDPSKWEGVAADDATLLRRPLLASGRSAGRQDPPTTRRRSMAFRRVPGLLDAARQAFQGQRAWHALVCRVRQSRRAAPGQRTAERAVLRHLHRQHQNHRHPGLDQSAGFCRRAPCRAAAAGRAAVAHCHGGLQAQGRQPRPRRSPRISSPPAPRSATASPAKTGLSGTAYYTFEARQRAGHRARHGQPGGLSNGSLDATQFAWLKTQLDRRGREDRHPLQPPHRQHDGQRPAGLRRERPAHSRAGRWPPCCWPTRRWCSGSTATPTSTACVAHKKTTGTGGFWELNTASHIDWPQQSRLVEIMDNQRRHPVDLRHDRRLRCARSRPARSTMPPAETAAISRLLSANDWQERTGHSATIDGRRGKAADRNVELLVPDPRPKVAQPATSSQPPCTSGARRFWAVQMARASLSTYDDIS